MNRRNFLRGTVSASLVAGLAVVLPTVQAGSAGAGTNAVSARFRGSADGWIYELGADGVTWQPRANFGPHCAISDVVERAGKVYARVTVQGHAFTLASPDGRRWHTLDRVVWRA